MIVLTEASPRLVVFGHSGDAAELINAITGTTLSETGDDNASSITETAAGTRFEGGPADLAENDATSGLELDSLPAEALPIYANELGYAPVVTLPYGDGEIVFLGWDWYDASPIGSQGSPVVNPPLRPPFHRIGERWGSRLSP